MRCGSQSRTGRHLAEGWRGVDISVRIYYAQKIYPTCLAFTTKSHVIVQIYRDGEDLIFDPVRQGDGGTYFCRARNRVGSSDELSITFDVLYEPRNLITSPERLVDLEVGNRAKFECSADGNPQPEFEWLQKVEGEKEAGKGGVSEAKVYSRGVGKRFQLKNVTYENEGMWVCTARNVIKGDGKNHSGKEYFAKNILPALFFMTGRERKIQSNVLRVDVSGKPQIQIFRTQRVQSFERNSDAELEAVFCADPKPRSFAWEWGKLKLEQGAYLAVESSPVT